MNERHGSSNPADVTSFTATNEGGKTSEGSRCADNVNFKASSADIYSISGNADSKVSTKSLPNATDKNQGELGSTGNFKIDKNYENDLNGKTGSTHSMIGNQDSAKPVEKIRVKLPRLNVGSENSSSSENFQKDTSEQFLEETSDEPLVDLNSGVALTPVACPDEARIWALAESDDGESPGNESSAGFPVTSRLFPDASRESPGSR